MKKLLLSLCLVSLSSLGFSQWASHTYMHDNTEREYNLFVPPSAGENDEFRLLLYMHGLGGDKEDAKNKDLMAFINAGDVIIIAPEALTYAAPLMTGDITIGTAWNNGMVIEHILLTGGSSAINGDIDDKGFILGLIDHVKSEYTIDENSVWATGFSMGGFMTQFLACESPQTFTAMASVSGTRAKAIQNCGAIKMPIMHIHGTEDPVVTPEGGLPIPILGTLDVGLSVEELVDAWKTTNATSSTPIVTNFDDTNTDGVYLEHHLYESADFNHRFEHYIVHGGDHTWYTSPQEFSIGDMLYEFFTKEDQGVNINEIENNHFAVYPNPARSVINIDMDGQVKEVNIYNLAGQLVKNVTQTSTIDIEDLSNQMYIIEAYNETGQVYRYKFVKQ